MGQGNWGHAAAMGPKVLPTLSQPQCLPEVWGLPGMMGSARPLAEARRSGEGLRYPRWGAGSPGGLPWEHGAGGSA